MSADLEVGGEPFLHATTSPPAESLSVLGIIDQSSQFGCELDRAPRRHQDPGPV